MDVTLSLDDSARLFYEEDPLKDGYKGSLFLSKGFVNRGHNLRIIHPNDIYKKGKNIYSRKVFSFDHLRGFNQIHTDSLLNGDIFFVYGMGEDKEFDVSKRFMDFLYLLENQYKHVLNSSESTSYEFKPKQKSLNFPWIPGFEIKSREDLIDLIKSGEKIIAKPSIGCYGKGVIYISDLDGVSKIEENRIPLYVFERFVPADEERRYMFLDNRIIFMRRKFKQGPPGKEIFSGAEVIDGDPREIEICNQVVSITGMFYGAVDFRGEYLLEVNGSGTGVALLNHRTNLNDLLDISPIIIRSVEKRFSSN